MQGSPLAPRVSISNNKPNGLNCRTIAIFMSFGNNWGVGGKNLWRRCSFSYEGAFLSQVCNHS